MKKRNAVIGGILLALVTAICTLGGVYCFLGLKTGDAAGAVKFLRALQFVRGNYVEEAPAATLMDGAIKGMVDSLGDPHSVYLDAKMFKEFMVETEGSFGGVGIVVGVKDKLLTVVAPIEGTPGARAGIKSGDGIVRIDGQETKGMALDQAVGKIRGPEGSQVVLTIRRDGGADKDYTLTRSNIQIKTVAGKLLPDRIGYIRISMFNENTGGDFAKELRALEQEGMQALVLDLRDNPGGLLEESVQVADHLVPKGLIVSVVTRDGRREEHRSSLPAVKYPLAVLVNGGSASASEILAGAVQDTRAGVLIGVKTYGKGSVQTVRRLFNGDAIKLTIAKYLTPAGRSINGVGITPDIVVEAGSAKRDVQLDKALEVLRGKLADAAGR